MLGTLLARGANPGSITGGLVGATDMKVTAGSGMQVLVAVGEAWINGTSNSVQGGYLGRVTSSTALAISASSESNNREDTIIAQVKDAAVAGGESTFSVSVVTGTAESGVTKGSRKGVGAVPASSLVLGYVFVEKKAVSIVSGDIENVAKRVELPSELVTDEAVVKGRALVATEGGFTSAPVVSGTEYEPSASRPSEVFLFLVAAGEKTLEYELYINGAGPLVFSQNTEGGPSVATGTPCIFRCMPKDKWKVVGSNFNAAECTAHTRIW